MLFSVIVPAGTVLPAGSLPYTVVGVPTVNGSSTEPSPSVSASALVTVIGSPSGSLSFGSTLPLTLVSYSVVFVSSLATGGSFTPGMETGTTSMVKVALSLAGLKLLSVAVYCTGTSPVKLVAGV